MAQDVQHFTVSCPAGITIANRQVTGLGLPPRIIQRIDWRVPPGPMGTMGFLIAMGGVPVFPQAGALTWVTVDDKDGYWELDGYPDSGAWQCVMYNTGANPHSVNLTFHADLPERATAVSAPLPLGVLSAAPDLSRAGPPVRGRLWPCCPTSRWPTTG